MNPLVRQRTAGLSYQAQWSQSCGKAVKNSVSRRALRITSGIEPYNDLLRQSGGLHKLIYRTT